MHSERTYLPGLNIGAGLRAAPGIVVDLSMISFGAVISEGNNPGDNALMRMGIPFNARSFAITFVMCVRAAFEAAYANRSYDSVCADIELVTLMTLAHCLSSPGCGTLVLASNRPRKAFVTKNALPTFRESVDPQSAIDWESNSACP